MVIVAALIGIALARHGALLSVETTAERNVRIGAFFDDESPMKGASVRLTDREGGVVAEGKTDERGFYTWTNPAPGYFVVIADDGAGHRGRQTFTLAALQLDGTVRDLIAETGREPTLGNRSAHSRVGSPCSPA